MRIKALTVVTLIALAVVLLVAVLGTVETRRRIQELESRSQVLATRHGSLEYREWGEGPPVVVIHAVVTATPRLPARRSPSGPAGTTTATVQPARRAAATWPSRA